MFPDSIKRKLAIHKMHPKEIQERESPGVEKFLKNFINIIPTSTPPALALKDIHNPVSGMKFPKPAQYFPSVIFLLLTSVDILSSSTIRQRFRRFAGKFPHNSEGKFPLNP